MFPDVVSAGSLTAVMDFLWIAGKTGYKGDMLDGSFGLRLKKQDMN